MDSLLHRLRQRKLVQWGATYLAGAWLVLQVLDFIGDNFDWSAAVSRTAIVLLAVGFLAALVLAWFHGERGEQRVSSLEIAMLAGILVLAGVGVALVRGRSGPSEGAPPRAAAAGAAGRKSIAVLPFANMSSDQENAYFAGGIHDELLTQLSKLGDLQVTSRTSVMQYAATTKPIRQIAGELGVGVVLEGSVQRAGNRVRVQAQLIDAATDEHLWAERYDRDLTDVFAIQSDIAQQIATALQARLTAGERATLAQRPTESAEAYDLYLQARHYHLRPNSERENLEAAVQLYERAIGLDPTFALAHAWLSHAHGQLRWWRYDRTAARVEAQRRAAARALELRPDLPEAHLAMGYYHYWGKRDYASALVELRTALRSAPNNADLLHAIGAVLRRQGNFEEAVRELERSLALDPRNSQSARDLANTYRILRRYPQAERTVNRALVLTPDSYDNAIVKGMLFVSWQGTVDTLQAAAHRFAPVQSGNHSPAFDRFHAARLTGDTAGARRAAEAAPEVISVRNSYFPRTILLGWARQRSGDREGALAAFESARRALEAALHDQADDERLHIAHGHALAGLGRRAEAEAAIRRAQSLMPPSRDAFLALSHAQQYAAIRAQMGDADGAIADLRRLLAGPSYLSTHDLRLDPIWDPIRADPRFQALLRTPASR